MSDQTEPPAKVAATQNPPVQPPPGSAPNPPAQTQPAPNQSGQSKLEQSPLKERQDQLEQELNDLENEVIVAGEWGIFPERKTEAGAPQPGGIHSVLADAHKALDDGKLDDAQRAILRGRKELNRAETSSWNWAINNQFGFLAIVLTALSTLLIYKFVFQMWLGLRGMNLLHYAAFAGLVGAILRNLYWLQYQTNRGLFRPRWFTSFIVAPPIGAILGWLVSLLVKVTVQAVSKDSVETDWRTISLLAAFAGFNWNWALRVLEDAAKSTLERVKGKSSAKKES